MSFSKHVNNKANNIYVMGKDYIEKINDTTIYDNSYLFKLLVGNELKFKTKTHQIINNQLCLGDLSFDWTKDESKKTSLYGNIYDFVVDYKAIVGKLPFMICINI